MRQRLTIVFVLVGLVGIVGGCGQISSDDPRVAQCLAEWNGPSNGANRAIIARAAAGDEVEVTAWNAAAPPEPRARGDGCGFIFFDQAVWISVSGYWTLDETLLWDAPVRHTQNGLTFRSTGGRAQSDGRIA